MDVFVTGATGAVGPGAVRALVGAGHRVRGVARAAAGADRVRAAGGEPVWVDLFDPASLRGALDGCGAVLHLATNVPPMAKMALERCWRTHNELRTRATSHLVDEARRAGVSVFVKESITLGYGDHADRWIGEDSALLETNAVLAAAADGERIAQSFTDHGRAVVLRFGLFYGPASRSTQEALRCARLRFSTLAGPPDAYVTSAHEHDVAAAAVAALDAPTGTYNVCDDEPLSRRAHADAFAAAFDLPSLRLLPGGLIRRLSPKAGSVLTASQRCSNARFRQATGWAPRYPDAVQGWAQTAAALAAT